MLKAEQCRELVSMSKLIKAFELNINIDKRSTCPFCGSTTGFSIKQDKYFKCFRCGEYGDIYKLLQAVKDIDFSKAHSLIADLVAAKSNDSIDNQESFRSKGLDYIFKLYIQEEKKHNKAYNYLKDRGIQNIQDYPVGLVTEKDFLKKSSNFTTEDLEKIGVLSKTGKEIFYNHLIFPYIDRNNKTVHLQGRSLNSEDKLRWVSTSGGSNSISNTLWGEQYIDFWKKKFGFVFLCEGLTDCYCLLSFGLPVLSSAGININFSRYYKMLEGLTVIAIYDNDRYPLALENPESNNYKSWSAILPPLINLYMKSKNINIKCVKIPTLPSVKDVNDLANYFNFESDKFLECLESNSKSIEDWVFYVYKTRPNYWDNILRVSSVKRVSKFEQKIESLIMDYGLMNYLYCKDDL
jgi:DNA primase catalytic core, N-terminal domain/CHC2 zinc finger